MVTVTSVDDEVVVDDVGEVELLSEPPLSLLPQPTAIVSSAAPPTSVIAVLEIRRLDPRGIRPSLPC
ncbi:hypothetical protein ACXDF8_07210 [Mycolicibacterium sp. CBM1]